jgi:ubiquinone/menaquinone biosynthesis C-methylase UbiE
VSFDALAPHYRWMEFLCAGGLLQSCRTHYLSQIRHSRDILVCGEGNGRFLCRLLEENLVGAVTCVDASSRMLAQSQARLRKKRLSERRVQFVHADILSWNVPPEEFDSVVTHFFLDCFTPAQLEVIIGRLARVLKPSGQWLLSDFRLADTGFARQRSRVILRLMYLFFRAATRLPARNLTNPDSFLARRGIQLKDRRIFNLGLLHSDLWKKP